VPGLVPDRGGELGFGGGELGRNGRSPGRQSASRVGGPHASTIPGEQSDASLLLKAADLVADRGLRVAKRPGSRGEGAVLRHRPEYEKPPNVQHG